MPDEARSSADQTESTRCLDCGNSFVGVYCGSCGQAAQSPIKPLGDFLRESLSEVFSLDGAPLRSLRALVTRPGHLSVEYLAGRRTRFLHPARLFLQVGVVAYLVTRLIPTESALFGIGPELFGDESSFADVLFAAGLIPLGATGHWLALRSHRPMFLEHFVFVLHIVSFSFLLAPVEGFLYLLTGGQPLLATANALFAPIAWGIYWLMALSRFNERTIRQAFSDALRVYIAVLLVSLPLFAYQFAVSF